MARLFPGGAASDRMEPTSFTAHSTLRTYAYWFKVVGAGSGRRIMEKQSMEDFIHNATVIHFRRQWSGNLAGWEITQPNGGAGWHHYVWTYDGGSTTNDPLCYADGSSITVTEFVAPAGTLQTNGDNLCIGNRRITSDVCADGALAEFVIYDRILTANEAAILYVAGPRALPYVPAAYWPLYGTRSPEPDVSGSNHHGTLTGTTETDHPPRSGLWGVQPRIVQVANVAQGGSEAGRSHLMLLGVG